MGDRARDLRTHYSHGGVVPSWLAGALLADTESRYVALLSMLGLGAPALVAAALALNALVVLALLVGYRSRSAAALAWLFLNAWHARNPIVLHAGDILTRLYLLLAVLLPLSKCCSLDHALKRLRHVDSLQRPVGTAAAGSVDSPPRSLHRAAAPRNAVVSVACLALVVQIGLVYATSALHKSGDGWRKSHDAIALALHVDYFRTSFGSFVLAHWPRALLRVCTWLVHKLELWGGILLLVSPLALLSPLGERLRAALVAAFVALHVAIATCMHLGIFPLIAITALVALLPPLFWDRWLLPSLARRERFRLGRALVRSFPAHSPLARLVVALADEFALLPVGDAGGDALRSGSGPGEAALASPLLPLSVADAGDTPGATASLPSRAASAAVVATSWRLHGAAPHLDDTSSTLAACERIAAASPLFCVAAPLLRAARALQRRSRWFAWLAGKATATAERFAAALAQSGAGGGGGGGGGGGDSRSHHLERLHLERWRLAKRTLLNFAACVYLLLVVTWCAGNVRLGFTTPPALRPLAFLLHVNQRWDMFSPEPPSSHWWYYMPARLDSGDIVDVFRHGGFRHWRGEAVDWSKPSAREFSESVGSHRWLKLFEFLNDPDPADTTLQSDVTEGFGTWVCREWARRNPSRRRRISTFEVWSQTQTFDAAGGYAPPLERALVFSFVCDRGM